MGDANMLKGDNEKKIMFQNCTFNFYSGNENSLQDTQEILAQFTSSLLSAKQKQDEGTSETTVVDGKVQAVGKNVQSIPPKMHLHPSGMLK